jgi:CRP/FNR family transcriptional regulator
MTHASCDLSRCFLCTHCQPAWKEAIAHHKQTFSYKKGQSIFTEGDGVEGIYFLYSGAVKVHRAWGTDKELILRFATEGDVLGHRAQGGSAQYEHYQISATCLEASVACYIPQAFLESSFKTNPSFLYRMMQLYADELQKAETRMHQFALMEVKGRIAQALLTIQKTFWVDEEGYIRVPVTRQDISAYAGTTYETVFKIFTDWQAQGLIDTSGKRIRITQPTSIKAFIPG